MDKKKLMRLGALLCAAAAVAGVIYIIMKKGDTSGAFAFVPAVAAVLLYTTSKDDGKKDDGKKDDSKK